MEKFKRKYRISTNRLSSWNYGWNGAYFVTICTQNHECYFGEIETDQMHLNSLGKIAAQCWHAIPQHFPFVTLGPMVVMPNHTHGIILIDVDTPTTETQDLASLPAHPDESITQNKFGAQSRNLASIIRGFKIGVTKGAKEINTNFAWQSRFHDHIIRNQETWDTISEYIENNPKNWLLDKLYKIPQKQKKETQV